MPYGLKDIELEKLGEVFAANERIERVVLYGSRAKGNYKPFSDVDITLEGPELTHTDLSRLSLAIDDLLLPYQFDISIFHTLKNEALIDHIRRMGITIYERKSEWKEYKLGEIADVQTGPFGSQLHMSDYQDEGTPIITVEHLGDNRIIHNNLPLVGDDDKNRLKKYVLAEGDIVFSRVGSVDRRAYVSAKEDGWMFSGRCLRVRPSQKVDAKFLSYYFGLEDFKETIRRIAVGATMPSINTTILSNVIIPLPPLDTQRRIAATLSSLDDKIDLLHRENATLEQMAETLFRQWFVEEAKEDWEEGKLGNFVEIVNGVSYKGEDLQPSEVGMVTLKSFDRNGGFRLDGYKDFCGKYKDTQRLNNGDLVIAHTDITQDAAVIGNPALVFADEKYKEITFSMDVVKVISTTPLFSTSTLYFLMKTSTFKDHCLGYANGSTVLHLSKKAIPEYEFLIPPKDVINRFNEVASSIVSRVLQNNKQIQILIQTRDGLLPRLMSGEVKILNC